MPTMGHGYLDKGTSGPHEVLPKLYPGDPMSRRKNLAYGTPAGREGAEREGAERENTEKSPFGTLRDIWQGLFEKVENLTKSSQMRFLVDLQHKK